MDSIFLAEVKRLVTQHGIECLYKPWLEEHNMMHVHSRANNSLENLSKELNLHSDWLRAQQTYVIDDVRTIVEDHGVQVLAKKWMTDNGYGSLYSRTRKFQLNLEEIAKRLEVLDTFQTHPKRKAPLFTQQGFDKLVQEVIDRYGCLPAAQFLVKNGYSTICNRMADYGPSFPAVRERFEVDNIKLQAINSMYLDSFAEVCWVNYLVAHGIIVLEGQAYPQEYCTRFGKNSGRYDPGFIPIVGQFQGKHVKVEIFGGVPGGDVAQKDAYLKTRAAKEKFHQNDPLFLALEFKDCYEDSRIAEILKPYIGEPDRVIRNERIQDTPATMLSIVDDTIKRAQQVCNNTPDGLIPPTAWFTRTGVFKNREIAAWEPQQLHGLNLHITKIGRKQISALMVRSQAQIDFEMNANRSPVLDDMVKIWTKTDFTDAPRMQEWMAELRIHREPLKILKGRLAMKLGDKCRQEKDYYNFVTRTLYNCNRFFTEGEREAWRMLRESDRIA